MLPNNQPLPHTLKPTPVLLKLTAPNMLYGPFSEQHHMPSLLLCPTLPLEPHSTQRQVKMNVAILQFKKKKKLFMNTEIEVSYNFHVSQIFLLISFPSYLKM